MRSLARRQPQQAAHLRLARVGRREAATVLMSSSVWSGGPPGDQEREVGRPALRCVSVTVAAAVPSPERCDVEEPGRLQNAARDQIDAFVVGARAGRAGVVERHEVRHLRRRDRASESLALRMTVMNVRAQASPPASRSGTAPGWRHLPAVRASATSASAASSRAFVITGSTAARRSACTRRSAASRAGSWSCSASASCPAAPAPTRRTRRWSCGGCSAAAASC